MSVSNGQLANQTTFNQAFMSRMEDTSAIGEVDFLNETESTTPDTGAVRVAGGVGVGGNINTGGNVDAEGDIEAVGNMAAANLSGTNTGDEPRWLSDIELEGGGVDHTVNVSASIPDARFAVFQLLDNANDYETMIVTIKRTETTVRILAEGLPAGTYRLIGRG